MSKSKQTFKIKDVIFEESTLDMENNTEIILPEGNYDSFLISNVEVKTKQTWYNVSDQLNNNKIKLVHFKQPNQRTTDVVLESRWYNHSDLSDIIYRKVMEGFKSIDADVIIELTSSNSPGDKGKVFFDNKSQYNIKLIFSDNSSPSHSYNDITCANLFGCRGNMLTIPARNKVTSQHPPDIDYDRRFSSVKISINGKDFVRIPTSQQKYKGDVCGCFSSKQVSAERNEVLTFKVSDNHGNDLYFEKPILIKFKIECMDRISKVYPSL